MMIGAMLGQNADGLMAVLIDWSGSTAPDLAKLAPTFLSYVLSFIYVGIYWNNHHHMLHAAERVDGAVLWANMHLLFWLSLIPFATGWSGENHFAPLLTCSP